MDASRREELYARLGTLLALTNAAGVRPKDYTMLSALVDVREALTLGDRFTAIDAARALRSAFELRGK